MTEVVAALIWDKDRFLICQRPANKARGLLWEFVGGKVEPGETPEAALIREIKEELNTTISIDQFLATVEYDYPEFHLSMDCYWCSIVEGHLDLIEHESAMWLSRNHLRDVRWLPADILVVDHLDN